MNDPERQESVDGRPWPVRRSVASSIIMTAVAALAIQPVSAQSVRYDLVSTGEPLPLSGPAVLTPNAQGYVRVQTAAHTIRCSLNTDLVACQSSIATWPKHPDGTPFAAVSLNAAGEFTAVDADLGQLAGLITLEDRTYTAEGWTFSATDTGLRFTNQRSGHGMDLGEDGVRSF